MTESDTIILVGGGGFDSDSRTTGEIVKSGTQFPLENIGYGTCATAYESGFVMIGGRGGTPTSQHGKVDRYDSDGNYLGSLPDIATPRSGHTCARFFTNEGEQALLIAGGINGNNQGIESSTELYLPSNNQWTRAAEFPRKLFNLMSGNLNQNVIVTGGAESGKNFRDEVTEYDTVTGRWSEVGHMQRARSSHAIVGVNLAAVCHIDSTGLAFSNVTTASQEELAAKAKTTQEKM